MAPVARYRIHLCVICYMHMYNAVLWLVEAFLDRLFLVHFPLVGCNGEFVTRMDPIIVRRANRKTPIIFRHPTKRTTNSSMENDVFHRARAFCDSGAMSDATNIDRQKKYMKFPSAHGR